MASTLVPALTLLNEGLLHKMYDENKHFPPQVAFGHVALR